MSTTPPLTVDASNRVHNTFDGSYRPTRRNSTYSDEIGVDYDENTKATSYGRVPTYPYHPSTFQPAVDASNHIHNMFDSFHKPVRRKWTRFDDLCVDHHENGMDTSLRRASSLLHPSSTSILTEDASKHVHNPPVGSYEPMCQHSTHSDALGIDYQQNPKDTSIRRVPSLVQPPLTSGCRTPTPMTSAPPVDTFSRVHNTTGPQDPTRRVPMGFDAPMSIETNYNPSHSYHNTTRRMSTCFDTLPGADVYNTKDTSS